jgi:hypothetical protein
VLRATWFVLAGMAITFGTLAVLALAIAALNRWLGPEAGRRRGRSSSASRA